MSCDYPRCNCPRDPDLAVQACFEKFCLWQCLNPKDEDLKQSFFKDWRAERAKEHKKARKTIPKEFLRHL